MTTHVANQSQRAIGRSPDRLTLEERHALTGQYVALEIYTPDATPLRRIEAIGDSIEECVKQLQARKLDPMHVEFTRLSPPYPL